MGQARVPDSEVLAVVLKGGVNEHARLGQVHALVAGVLPGLAPSHTSRALSLLLRRLVLLGFL